MTSRILQIDLNPHDLTEVIRILELYVPELEVWAFGSRVKWTAKAHSDLDLALITQAPLSLERFAELREAFDESQLPIRVDLVDWANTSESFREIIKQQKVVVKLASKADEQNIHWPVITLEAALEALIDYRGKTPEKTTSGVPLVTAKVIKNGRIEKPTEFIAVESYDAWMRRGIPKAGDIVLTTEAPLGEVAQLGKEKVALAQRVITLRGKPGILDNGYLLYLLQTEEMQEQLRSRATGTTVLGIKQSELRKITIRVPPINLQQSAATTLRALDDRITLLRENNVTLEAVTQALFKSWFVDFDPVHAKQKGREPEGMDEATAALFPDSFEDLAGSICLPTGWDVDTIKSRTSNIQYGFTQSASTAPIGPHFLRITDIRNSKIDWQSVPFCEATDDQVKKYRVMDGDIFVARTGASTGDNIYVVNPALAVFASYLVRFQFRSRGIGRIVGEFMKTSEYKNYVSGMIGGSAQPNANAQILAGATMVFPSEEIATAFYELIRPLDIKRTANSRNAQTLSALRDILLPRLISGQLHFVNMES